MFKSIAIFLMILGLSVMCTSVYAVDYNAGSKLGRGVANIPTGWLEFPKQIYLETSKDVFYGPLYGMAKGACDLVLRTVTGVLDVSFFIFPPYDRPFMEPEFVFEGWEQYPG